MPSTTVYNMAGEAIEELELSEQVFGVTPNVAVLHQVVTAQLVNRRQGNASTKTRAEVSGGREQVAPAREARVRHSSAMVVPYLVLGHIPTITMCPVRCAVWPFVPRSRTKWQMKS